jgi:hypothetical protein
LVLLGQASGDRTDGPTRSGDVFAGVGIGLAVCLSSGELHRAEGLDCR